MDPHSRSRWLFLAVSGALILAGGCTADVGEPDGPARTNGGKGDLPVELGSIQPERIGITTCAIRDAPDSGGAYEELRCGPLMDPDPTRSGFRDEANALLSVQWAENARESFGLIAPDEEAPPVFVPDGLRGHVRFSGDVWLPTKGGDSPVGQVWGEIEQVVDVDELRRSSVVIASDLSRWDVHIGSSDVRELTSVDVTFFYSYPEGDEVLLRHDAYVGSGPSLHRLVVPDDISVKVRARAEGRTVEGALSGPGHYTVEADFSAIRPATEDDFKIPEPD